MINILQLISSAGIGGAETHTYQLIKGLHEHENYHVLLACPSNGPLVDKVRELGVEILPVEMNSKLNIVSIIKLIYYIKKKNVSIVHTHIPKADFFGGIAAIISMVPLVVTLHGDFVRDTKRNGLTMKYYKFFYRILYKKSKCIIAISNYIKQGFEDWMGKKLPKIKVIYNGSDLSRSKGGMDTNKEQDIIIGNIGRLVPLKRQEDFLIAASNILKKRNNVRFLLVGDGELREYLEGCAEELRIKDRFAFLGEKAATEIYPILDILVCCSEWEGFGRVITEAMSFSKPVIATMTGAIPEIVVDGETGILVPPRNPELLSIAIESLLDNPVKREQLGKSGYERFQKYFTTSIFVKNTEKVFNLNN